MKQPGKRIQKILSDQGILSRRKTEQAVLDGRITINGRPAVAGQPVDLRRDVVTLDGQRLVFNQKNRHSTILLYKPRGYLADLVDQEGRKGLTELLQEVPGRVYPVSRLDRGAEGLLLLTGDGFLARDLMRVPIPATYRVTISQKVTEDQLIALSNGVGPEGCKTVPWSVHVLGEEPGRTILQMTADGGQSRQIRLLCEFLHLSVARIKAVAFGPVKLGMLKTGEWRELKSDELAALRNQMIKSGERTAAGEKEQKPRRDSGKTGARRSRPAPERKKREPRNKE